MLLLVRNATISPSPQDEDIFCKKRTGKSFPFKYSGGGGEPSIYRIESPEALKTIGLAREEMVAVKETSLVKVKSGCLISEPKLEKWLNRESEIEGFFSDVQALRGPWWEKNWIQPNFLTQQTKSNLTMKRC